MQALKNHSNSMITIKRSRVKKILFKPAEEIRVTLNVPLSLKLTKINLRKSQLLLQVSKQSKHFIACIKVDNNTKKNKNIWKEVRK